MDGPRDDWVLVADEEAAAEVNATASPTVSAPASEPALQSPPESPVASSTPASSAPPSQPLRASGGFDCLGAKEAVASAREAGCDAPYWKTQLLGTPSSRAHRTMRSRCRRALACDLMERACVHVARPACRCPPTSTTTAEDVLESPLAAPLFVSPTLAPSQSPALTLPAGVSLTARVADFEDELDEADVAGGIGAGGDAAVDDFEEESSSTAVAAAEAEVA